MKPSSMETQDLPRRGRDQMRGDRSSLSIAKEEESDTDTSLQTDGDFGASAEEDRDEVEEEVLRSPFQSLIGVRQPVKRRTSPISGRENDDAGKRKKDTDRSSHTRIPLSKLPANNSQAVPHGVDIHYSSPLRKERDGDQLDWNDPEEASFRSFRSRSDLLHAPSSLHSNNEHNASGILSSSFLYGTLGSANTSFSSFSSSERRRVSGGAPLEEQVLQLTEHNRSLSEQLSRSHVTLRERESETSERLVHSKQQRARLEHDIAEVRRENRKLEQQLLEFEVERGEWKCEQVRLVSTISERDEALRTERAQFEDRKSQLQNKLTRLEGVVEDREKDISRYISEQSFLSSDLRKAKEEVLSLSDQLREAQKECDSQRSENKELCDRLSSLSAQTGEMRAEMVRLRDAEAGSASSLEDTVTRLRGLEEERATLTCRLSETERARNSWQQNAHRLEEQVSTLRGMT